MTTPVVFGFAQSVYVRSVRLALEEKGVAYRLDEIDPFVREAVPADYARRHPFGKVPAFEHDGFRLYETDAIVRYIDEVFAGAPLIPGNADTFSRRPEMRSCTKICERFSS